MKRTDVDLRSHVGIDPEQFSDDVRARLEEFVAAREQRLVELRERAVDAEQEQQVLRSKVESLQQEVATLEDRVGERDLDSLTLDPTTVLSSFGDSLQQEQIQQSGFTVSDISVDLRATVVSTEDGIRLHLPEPGSSLPDGALSELRFSVRSDPGLEELDYEEVPDLIGMTETGATDAIEAAGFTVGSVETVPADAEPGRVVDQLPSPYSLADPGAPIDLEIAEPEPAEMVNLIGERLTDAVRFVGDRFTLRDIETVESDEPPGTVIDQDPEPGDPVSLTERIALTVSEFRGKKEAAAEAEAEPEEIEADEESVTEAAEAAEAEEEAESEEAAEAAEDAAEEAEAAAAEGERRESLDEPMSARMAERVLDAMDSGALEDDAEPLVDRDVTEVDGIGDTYGQRLRNAGIESLADLAVAEPFEIADAANVSRDRASDWIEAVRTRLEIRTGRRDEHPESGGNSDR